MQSKMSLKIILLLLLFTLNLFAIDGKIKVFIKTDDAIYTSQKITVSVELFSSAFSITDARITFPPSNKYIVQAPKSASYLGQEEVEGESWQMVHYEYEVYALQAGKVALPPLSISFSASMGYGQPKKEFVLKSDALYFDVKSPGGIKNNQFVLVTDNYALDSQIKPEKKKVIIGDAVELSITQKAHDVPDILLRPIVYTSNAFLRVYDKEPELKSGLKGRYDVSRTDRFTFVASGEGNVTIPAQEIIWWNFVTKKVQVETIPDMSFEISSDPQIAIDAKKAQQKQIVIYITVTLLFLILCYVLFASKIKECLVERKRVYELSEEGHFNTLLKSKDTHELYLNFYTWLVGVSPDIARDGFQGVITLQPSFKDVLGQLEVVLVYDKKVFDKELFFSEVKKFRKLLRKEREGEQGLPRKINPR